MFLDQRGGPFLGVDSVERGSELPPSQCIPRSGVIAAVPVQAGHCASLFVP
jgi:hypothetical protein